MTEDMNNSDPVDEPDLGDALRAVEDDSSFSSPSGGAGSEEFDAANKSLASALRISFVALQLVMVVLVGVYIFSGWRNVPEQSRGLRLLFGGIQDSEALEAGGYFTWPYPIGQFVLVPKSVQTVEVIDSFWVHDTKTPFAKIVPATVTSLVPGEDGSVITSDYNLAHTQWSVQYQIIDAPENIKTMATAKIPFIVKKAVERGVVLAAAETTLDDIITAPDEMRAKVRLYAQEFLDRVKGGIRITQVTETKAVPPRPVLEDYEQVNLAENSAAQQSTQAKRRASEVLNQVAGPAYGELRKLIGEYDTLLALAQADPTLTDQAEAKLAQINDVLMSDRVGGMVATIIGTATARRGELTSSFKNDLERFRAWKQRYEENPELTKVLLWAGTMRRVAAKNIEWFGMPTGQKIITILANPDPQRRRDLERMKKMQNLQPRY